MEIIKSGFEISRTKDGFIIFKAKRANNSVYETPKFIRDVVIESPQNKMELKLNKVIFRKGEILFRFNKSNVKLPTRIYAKISYKNSIPEKDAVKPQAIVPDEKITKEKLSNGVPVNNLKISLPVNLSLENPGIALDKKFLEMKSTEITKSNIVTKSNLETKRQMVILRNPHIYTNVESGYAAKSFPNVYIQRYKYGPQGDKFQTTPQVAPVYSPR